MKDVNRPYRIAALLAVWGAAALCVGCQSPQYGPDWSWAPGSGARISPPATGRGAYGSPDPYYNNVPRGQSSISRDDDYYAEADPRDSLRNGDDRRDYGVATASYEDPQDADGLRFKGMPKSGEPKRFQADSNLVELTELPESRSRTARTSAAIMRPSSRPKRTPYRDVDRGYDEDYRAASRTDGGWRRRQ